MVNTIKAFHVVQKNCTGPFFFTAEHSSNIIPVEHTLAEDDFLQSHWGWDIGIDSLMTLLCQKLSCRGVKTTLSRLWIDTNRAPTQKGLIKTHIESVPLSFNQNLYPQDVDDRLRLHEDYHQAITQHLRAHTNSPILVSLHSFTPIWNNQLRNMDIGVLFDRDTDLAHCLAQILEDLGFFVALNEPYSGKNGLIYSADRHGTQENIPYVELEFNQSILSAPKRISFVAERLCQALRQLQAKMKD